MITSFGKPQTDLVLTALINTRYQSNDSSEFIQSVESSYVSQFGNDRCGCYTTNTGYTFIQIIILLVMLEAIGPQLITDMQFLVPHKFQLLQTASHAFGCTVELPFYVPYPGLHLTTPVWIIVLLRQDYPKI